MPRPGVFLPAMSVDTNCSFLPAVGPQQRGTNKTKLRRLQRKHTQHCYILLTNKLISLVRPIPETVVVVEDLEHFRAILYSDNRMASRTSSFQGDTLYVHKTKTQDFSEQPESQSIETKEQTRGEPQTVTSVTCSWCGGAIAITTDLA